MSSTARAYLGASADQSWRRTRGRTTTLRRELRQEFHVYRSKMWVVANSVRSSMCPVLAAKPCHS